MSKRILVIDDEQFIVLSLQKLLTHEGYTVETASDAAAALEKVKAADFDLIISDVRMPGMDGVDSIMQIREHLKGAGKPPVPEIIITGFADLDRYEKAKELGVAAYIYKPFDNAEFLRVIEEVFQ